MIKQEAVFLDRDGTLVEDAGYLKKPKDIDYYADVFTALLLLQKAYKHFIVTNQKGVAKGAISLKEVGNINSLIEKRFYHTGISITETYVCPHSKKDNCKCRKPKPFFLEEAAQKFNIDLSKSYMIGDHPSDIFNTENSGANDVYLLTGRGLKQLHEFNEKPVHYPDLLEAARYIINKKTQLKND